MNSKIVSVNGAQLNVVDVGEGQPVVFVHGFPLDHQMWRHQIEAYSSDYRVIVPDLRGFGKSEGDVDQLSMELMADDVAALLDVLGVEEPVIFCGLSMGGYVGWQFVTKYRQRLKALILCDTKSEADTTEAADNRKKMAELIRAKGIEYAALAMMPKLCSATTVEEQPELVAELKQVILETDPDVVIAALGALASRPDATAWLAGFDFPCLVVVGEDDAITPPDGMKELAGRLPQATYTLVKRAGHMAPLENPTETNSAITQFLKQLN